jgi:hypothetical protein
MNEMQQVRERLALNLARVHDMIVVYRKLASDRGDDEPTDVLRAAVVLLHATMEDVLRTLEQLALRQASPATLKRFGIAYGGNLPDRLTLHELAGEYVGTSVEDVIRQATRMYIERKTYNNCGELAGTLHRLRMPAKPLLDPFARDLEVMMRRRHQIVHRADLDESASGDASALARSPLPLAEVAAWVDTVSRFGDTVVERSTRSAAS